MIAACHSSAEYPTNNLSNVLLASFQSIVQWLRRGGCTGVGKASTQATTGDDEAYDSDEYDESTINKVQAGAEEDAEDWGEFEDKADDWGTSASSALTAKKHAQRIAASEGRIYTVLEAREKLEQLDLATAKAQGWLRGQDAAQRLSAMEMLISAYPPQPDAPASAPATAPATPAAAEEHRIQAGNPFDMFTKGLWQQRPHRQEEERLAVQAHLQTSTAAAALAAQTSGPKPLPVPEVNFFDAWKATDQFSAECAFPVPVHHREIRFVQPCRKMWVC